MKITERMRERVACLENPLERLRYAASHVPRDLAHGVLALAGPRYCVVGWLAVLDGIPVEKLIESVLPTKAQMEALYQFYGLQEREVYELMYTNDTSYTGSARQVAVRSHLDHIIAARQATQKAEENTSD